MRTLALTSPLMRGKDVREAQQLLLNNKFNQDYLQGVVDGEFGEETARACKRAKYWLGYKTTNMKPTYGKFLHAQLSGQRPLSDEMKKRRAERLEEAKQKPLRLKAVEEARKDIGMKENPAGSNICPISKEWKLIGPWCNMSTSLWYIRAGSKAFRKGVNWAYVPEQLSAAARGDYGLSLTRNPEPGDLAPFDWDNDGVADHIGIMTSKVDANGYFKTIEGNTSATNNSNGGECQPRDRHISDVAIRNGRPAFIHVGK